MTEDEVEEGEGLVVELVEGHDRYGQDGIPLYVDLLLHLVEQVGRYGAVWTQR